MATKAPTSKIELPPIPLQTMIEVFGFKGDRIFKTAMTYERWMKLEKKTGWIYRAYEPRYCSIKPTE